MSPMKRFIVFFTVLFPLLGAVDAQSQNRVVTGTVVEVIDGAKEPILGANVVL